MKVLLTQDVENLGLAGEIKDVSNGYGRNYLIPGGMAVLATAGALQQADVHRRRAVKRRARISAEMEALARAVGKTSLTFQSKAGDKGRLYGSITSGDIAEKLSEAIGQEIDRRKIVLETPIKQLGAHQVTMRLSGEHTADFEVVVESLEPVADEKSADEKSVDEKSVDEKPVDEKPVDEKSVDEKPVDEKPASAEPTAE
jgi:large subunit ribosomal protein L9